MDNLPTKKLPEHYQFSKTLDLHNNKSILLLNLVGVGFLILSIYIFDKIVMLLRPDHTDISPFIGKISLSNILLVFLASFLVIILHEFIHGIFFWIYTREKPIFKFKFLYAFAAAPDWYIPRDNFVNIGLSPVILITVLVIFLFMIVPSSMVKVVSLAGILNFAGSIGDFAVVIWSLLQPKNCLVRDSGDSFDIYQLYLDYPFMPQ